MPVIAENTAETPAIACGLHAIICGLQVVKLRHSKVKWLIVMWLVGGGGGTCEAVWLHPGVLFPWH